MSTLNWLLWRKLTKNEARSKNGKLLSTYQKFVVHESAVLKVEMPKTLPKDRMREIGKRWQILKACKGIEEAENATRKRARSPSAIVSSAERPVKIIARPAKH